MSAEVKRDQEAARYMRLMTHVRSALAIAHKHRDESVAWDDVAVLLEDVALNDYEAS